MTKKMTTGEIAKKVGISQKAVRLYDEKGLLKPSEYSEGNYRLYDKEALLVLEKIIALKQVGFSLEEIKENLIYRSYGSEFGPFPEITGYLMVDVYVREYILLVLSAIFGPITP